MGCSLIRVTSTDRMASIADHYAARRGTAQRNSGSGVRRTSNGRPIPSNGYPRARTSLIANREKRKSLAPARLSKANMGNVAKETIQESLSGKEPATKRIRTSKADVDDAPATPIKTADPQPAAKPQVRIASTAIPNTTAKTVDLTAAAKKHVEASKARRKSRSSMGRQSMSRNAVLGASPGVYFQLRLISLSILTTKMRLISKTQRIRRPLRVLEVVC